MEALGLIDAIITTIQDSPRKTFSKNKAIIDTNHLIDMLEKLKIIVHRGEGIAQQAIQVKNDEDMPVVKEKLLGETNPEAFGADGEALLIQAKEEALKIKGGADGYADNVLENLLVIISKMQRTIENGRQRLTHYKEST